MAYLQPAGQVRRRPANRAGSPGAMARLKIADHGRAPELPAA
jgi:hypothetical protein